MQWFDLDFNEGGKVNFAKDHHQDKKNGKA
jgi:hypothetical protein